jgi:hypothetical protein
MVKQFPRRDKMSRLSRLVASVRTHGCIAIGIGELRRAWGYKRTGAFITERMRRYLRDNGVAIGSEYRSLPSEVRPGSPSHNVLLYDAREQGEIQRLFRFLDTVRSGKTPYDMVLDYNTRLRRAAELFRE